MNWKVKIAKRAIDVVGALVGLAITAPLFVIIAIAVKLDSPGPILYRQRRARLLLGHERVEGAWRVLFSEFEMPKFRTMRTDAERLTGAVLAARSDARVTRLGRRLRRTRLDELPQLWCVLKGEMSLVGPRPERPELLRDLAMAIPLFEERMRGVKPGITGLAQINLGYDGAPPPGSAIAARQDEMVNPYRIDEAVGATADAMRIKLLYDLAYGATLDDFWAWARTEAEVLVKTPTTMLLGKGY
jgi:lipopolysaccharide/colanic/teichoic acid biosynthesis glycosyltransferase